MSKHVLLIKHAMPVLDAALPAREWVLGRVGRDQARKVALDLTIHSGARLVTSSEAKALQTGRIIAEELGASFESHAGLDEIHRPIMPILPAAEYEHLVGHVFDAPSKAVIGAESARDAERRYSRAMRELDQDVNGPTLIIISHGIVISLFVRRHNNVDVFRLWKSLSCSSAVVLESPTYRIVDMRSLPACDN